jgi:hypothetical protein
MLYDGRFLDGLGLPIEAWAIKNPAQPIADHAELFEIEFVVSVSLPIISAKPFIPVPIVYLHRATIHIGQEYRRFWNRFGSATSALRHW